MMENELLEKIKYFRYIDISDPTSDYKEDDVLSCVYEILSFDENKKGITARWLEDCEDDYAFHFSISIFENHLAEILNTEDIENYLKEAEEKRKAFLKKQTRELKERFLKSEEVKESHFKDINPNIKRGLKVLLVGKFDHSLIDFSRKGDSFFIDDVKAEQGIIYYGLRVQGDRKNRGVYTFYTKLGFKEENLKVDLTPYENKESDFIVNGVVCTYKGN